MCGEVYVILAARYTGFHRGGESLQGQLELERKVPSSLCYTAVARSTALWSGAAYELKVLVVCRAELLGGTLVLTY